MKSVPDVKHNIEVPSSPAMTGAGALISSSRSLLQRTPPPSLSNNRSSRTSEPPPSLVPVVEPFATGSAAASGGETLAMTFEEVLARCTAMLGVPVGLEAQESLRRVLKAWSEGGTTFDGGRDVSMTRIS